MFSISSKSVFNFAATSAIVVAVSGIAATSASAQYKPYSSDYDFKVEKFGKKDPYKSEKPYGKFDVKYEPKYEPKYETFYSDSKYWKK